MVHGVFLVSSPKRLHHLVSCPVTLVHDTVTHVRQLSQCLNSLQLKKCSCPVIQHMNYLPFNCTFHIIFKPNRKCTISPNLSKVYSCGSLQPQLSLLLVSTSCSPAQSVCSRPSQSSHCTQVRSVLSLHDTEIC